MAVSNQIAVLLKEAGRPDDPVVGMAELFKEAGLWDAGARMVGKNLPRLFSSAPKAAPLAKPLAAPIAKAAPAAAPKLAPEALGAAKAAPAPIAKAAPAPAPMARVPSAAPKPAPAAPDHTITDDVAAEWMKQIPKPLHGRQVLFGDVHKLPAGASPPPGYTRAGVFAGRAVDKPVGIRPADLQKQLYEAGKDFHAPGREGFLGTFSPSQGGQFGMSAIARPPLDAPPMIRTAVHEADHALTNLMKSERVPFREGMHLRNRATAWLQNRKSPRLQALGAMSDEAGAQFKGGGMRDLISYLAKPDSFYLNQINSHSPAVRRAFQYAVSPAVRYPALASYRTVQHGAPLARKYGPAMVGGTGVGLGAAALDNLRSKS